MNEWEPIISFFTNLLSAVLPGLLTKKESSKYRQQYEELRQEVAEALSMYANCLHNPVDLAEMDDHRLPPLYAEGAHRIRELASRLKALASTMPDGKNDLPVKVDDIDQAADCMFGISNSFHTPYGWKDQHTTIDNIEKYEKNVRKSLKLR